MNNQNINQQIKTGCIRSRIRQTKSFNLLSKPSAKVFMNRTNIQKVTHALNVISNIGFEQWKKISNYQSRTIEIIKELI